MLFTERGIEYKAVSKDMAPLDERVGLFIGDVAVS